MTTGGHMCSSKEQCSVLGLALNNCRGQKKKCSKCNYFYCEYHYEPGSWYSAGGHTCS